MAAKSMVVSVKERSQEANYMLAVIPGNRKVNMKRVKRSLNVYDVSLAPYEKAGELTYCQMGAVPPFSFHRDLFVIVDPLLMENEEIVFNAGLLDTSIAMKAEDYLKAVQPHSIMEISAAIETDNHKHILQI
ncbi:hypothetical protein YSY43_28650 [Paenibacillus sp. YSY-4.3]